MKITCQSCQAKYTIADDKVVGKTVKIKCKKCGSAIVVQGDAMHAAAAAQAAQGDSDEGAETRVFAEGGGGAAPAMGAGEWLVNVAEGDERTMTAAQIAAEYANGTLTHETYVWKDGMSEWLPLSSVPELMQAAAAQAPAPAYAAPASAVQEPPMGLMGTVVMDSGTAQVSAPAAAAAPAAARRAVNRGGVDVFGAREQAESASVAGPSAPPPPGGVMTGARNENSVLFSLSALTAAETAVKAQEEKGVIDPRPGPSRPGASRPPPARNGGGRAGLDDIMNLGGGGIGAPMLAPPPVLAPVVEAPPPPPPTPVAVPAMGAMGAMGAGPMGMPDMPQQKKAPVGLIIGGIAAVLVVGGVAAAALGVFSSPPPEPVASNETTANTSQPEAKPAETAAVEAKPAETAAADAKPAETAAADAKPEETAAAVAAANPGAPKPGGPLPTGGGAKPAEKEPPKEEKKPAEPPKEEKKPEPAPQGSGEFSRGAATSALGAAAGAAKACKKPDGPTGTGRVRVTFAPSGNVTSAQVQGPPFAGTAVGGCVAGTFRGARVPPFSGAPVSVTKSFTIN